MAPIKIFFIIFNVALIPIFGFILLFFLKGTFSYRELNEIKNSFNLSPLMNIESYQYSQTDKIGLFGEYKGFKGGHEYRGCSQFYTGTCQNDLNKNVTCIGYYEDEDGTNEYSFYVNKERCIDYKTINSFSYDKLKGKYYYGTKMSQTYKDLVSSTVNKDKECPKNKKNCGLLNKDIKLCLPIEEKCPINDIVINNKATYNENGLNYSSIEFGDNYIHFTNEKTSNDIIFDLILSIESPLSIVEIEGKSKEKDIFKLHKNEDEEYFSGNIKDIRGYKKLFDTGMTLKDLFNLYGKFDTIQTEPYYKAEYFFSKIYIYIKYPVPLNDKSYEYYSNKDKSYMRVNSYFTGCCIIFIISIIMTGFLFKKNMRARIISYILLTICHFVILILFILSSKTIFHSDILTYYKEKNKYRIRLLALFIVIIILAIYQNLFTLYFWKKILKLEEEEEEKEKKELEDGKQTPLYSM